MDIHAVPCLHDNYSYIIVDRDTKNAACVDPVEPKKVVAQANKIGAKIVMGICTHKHLDHSGGNVELATLIPSLRMYGSAYEDTPGITHPIRDQETFKLGTLSIQAFHTPCHTKGHELFYVSTPNASDPPALFTGDTLFIGGCGRFFEGTAEQMVYALCIVIANLPRHTQIFCGHEYTVANLRFLQSVDPANKKLEEKLAWAENQRKNHLPTVPSTVGEELEYNLFMRVSDPVLKCHLSGVDTISDNECMALLRERKNCFA